MLQDKLVDQKREKDGPLFIGIWETLSPHVPISAQKSEIIVE